MNFTIGKLLIALSSGLLLLSMERISFYEKQSCGHLTNDTILCRKDTFYYKQQDTLPYLLQFPASYDPKKELPLVVYLHSGSSRLKSLETLENFGLPAAYSERNKDNFIALSPLLIHSNETWVNKAFAVLKLIQLIESKFRIDRSKIFITGHSLGSNGSLYVTSVSKNIFAGVVVLGAGYLKGDTVPGFSYPAVWMIHGAKDENVPTEVFERTVKDLRKFNTTVTSTVIPDFTHSMLLDLYRKDTIYNWLLSHH